MENAILKYPRGSVIVLTSGAYSNFGIDGLIVAAVDLDFSALAKQYVSKGDSGESKDYYGFTAWLISSGYAMPVEHSQVHLGDYEFSDDFIPEV